MLVLLHLGYLEESILYKGHQTYCISVKGLQVIEELNNSYQVELIKFCNTYNIVL
jgi:hypothetical protein